LLREVEEAQNDDDFVEMNIFQTGTRIDMGTSTFEIASRLYHRDTGRDLITCLRCRTQLEAPDWGSVFADLSEKYPPQTLDVYYCGSPALGRTLRRTCESHGFSFFPEPF
jgi:hypothetical protein